MANRETRRRAGSKREREHAEMLEAALSRPGVREVMDIEAETLVFARGEASSPAAGTSARPRFSIREILPPHDPGPWPEGFTVSREQLYGALGSLKEGPENASGGDR